MTTKAAASAASDVPRGGSGQMFDRIAERYDLLNRVISFGADQGWRRKTVASLELAGATSRVLDVACGTADLTIAIAQSAPGCRVVGLDPSVGMLEVGRRKIAGLGLDAHVTLREGTAEQLPFEDDAFDACSIAFGIRNVPDRPRALAEFARVTRPGGRVAILELSEPPATPMGALARVHVHKLVPFLGGLLSGDREYRYLQQSIAEFPPPADFAELMTAAGLRVLDVLPLTFGVCHLYVGTPVVVRS